MDTGAGRGDGGTGIFGSTFAFVAFLLFLLLAVQVVFGLYARTTVTAVAADLAQHAANEGADLDDTRFADYEAEADRRLGGYGDDARFTFSLVDADADGLDDTVAVHVTAELPTVLPLRWSGHGPGTFTRTVRARLEVFQEPAP